MGEVVCRYAKLFANLDLGALLLFAHGEPWHFSYLQLPATATAIRSSSFTACFATKQTPLGYKLFCKYSNTKSASLLELKLTS
jgi:hypothetical protein